MKFINKILVMLFFFSCELISQETDTIPLKPKFGVFGNYTFNIQYANFSNSNLIPSCCQDNMFGVGDGYRFGLLMDYWFNDVYGMQLRLAFENLTTQITQEESVSLMLYDKDLDDFVPKDGKFEFIFESNLKRIFLHPSFAYHARENLDLFAGFDFGYFFSSDFKYIEKIKEPIGGYFKDTQLPTRNKLDSIIDNNLNFGISIGASYQLRMNKDSSLFLCPEFFYTFLISSVVPDAGWNIHSFNLGFALKYLEPPPPPPPPDPPLEPPLPKYPGLPKPSDIFVDIVAIQMDSINNVNKDIDIKIEDFVSHTMSPMLNYIFFPENSSEIPDRYIKLTKESRDTFHLEHLRKLGVLETYYYILNIMGLRLHLDKSAKITLIGTNSYTGEEKGNMQLSKDRAMSVKNYFVDVWEVEPDRIEIKSRHLPDEPSNAEEIEGQEENRRVEFISDDWRITEPVIVVDTTRNINKTTLRFYPKVKTESGLRSWKIMIKQNQKIIKDFSGSKVIPDSLNWELSSNSPESQLFGDNMTYSLIVEDGIGQFASTTEKKLPVEQMTIERKKIEKKLDREYEFYSLIIFEFGKSTLRGEHKKVVDIIKQRLKPNSKVIITGHTDIMGKEQLNKRIATKRAISVAKHLNIPDTQIIGIGQENLLYDNTLPEGRFYCRTVRITIETPIENK